MEEGALTPDRRRLLESFWFCAGLVALATVIAYATSLKVPFLHWDDTLYVTDSVRTRTPGLTGFLNLWSSRDIWTGRFLEFFPLRDSVYWVIWQLFGQNPLPFHLVNVALHALASVLVMVLGRRLGFSREVALGGALLFAVHPAHVESVTWIAALKDPMFTSFLLGSVIFYLRYRERIRPVDYALSLGCLVGGLLCKSLALAAPLLFLAAEAFLPRRARWRTVLLRLAGPGVIAAIFLVQFVLVGKAANVIVGPHGGSWSAHWFLTGWAFVRYVQQAFIPAYFALEHCFAPPSGAGDPRLWGILLLLAVVTAGLVVAWRRAPRAAFLICWFLACLLPVANIVPFPALMADRYLYAPSVAACLGLAWACELLRPELRRLVLGLVIAGFCVTTLARGVVWQDERRLWAEVTDNEACAQDDEDVAAVVFFNRAAGERDPRVALGWYEKGLAHRAFGKLRRENRCNLFDEATQLAISAREPGTAKGFAERATALCPDLPASWHALGSATVRQEPSVAIDAARRAYRLTRRPIDQWYLGQARLSGRDTGGLDDIDQAVQAIPGRLCRFFLPWAKQVYPHGEPRLADAVRACAQPPR